jgi:hypothetical protein
LNILLIEENRKKTDLIGYFPYLAGVLAYAYEYRNQKGKIGSPYIYLRCFGALGISYMISRYLISTLDQSLMDEKVKVRSLRDL